MEKEGLAISYSKITSELVKNMNMLENKNSNFLQLPVDLKKVFLLLILIVLAASTELHATVFSDDFSSDTTANYAVVDTPANGIYGSLSYDAAGQRMRVLTGDNIALQFSRALPSLSSGFYSIDFLPTAKYPAGGIIAIRLLQDQSNYYEVVYSDGYANRKISKVVNGVIVDSVASASQYIQNKAYHVSVTFSPGQFTVNTFGTAQSLNVNSSPIQVVSFEIQLSQQDAYFDNINYYDTPPADVTPPLWSTSTGIVSAVDTGAGGSVSTSFGSAVDAVDGTNVSYKVYYAPSSIWSSDWSQNSVVSATAGPVTVSGLTNNIQYTFGVRVADKSGNEDSNAITLTATPTFSGGSVFFDDFSSNTTASYTVVNTPANGVSGSLSYDAAGQRMHVLTGDDIALRFSRFLPVFSTGYFSFDFLPTAKYPAGGIITVRLRQDQNNYYEIVYSDGYANRLIKKVVNGVVVQSVAAAKQYAQNNTYRMDVSFSPGQLTVNAFGTVQTLNQNNSPIQVASFEIQLSQQDAFFDNIYYSNSPPPADTTPPVWDTTTGIVSAVDTGAGGSVRIYFGGATDAVDGTNVSYNVYYAPSSIWSGDWSLNGVVSAAVGPVTISGLTSGVAYTFGVRVADQDGNEDTNGITLAATPTFSGGSVFSDDFGTDTTADYTVVNTPANGVSGSLSYDAAGNRLHVLTGDNIALQFSSFLPVFSTGYFSFDFLPTAKYPAGGIITVRLRQDQNNYYEIVYSDGYANRLIKKVVNGVVVQSVAAAKQYAQNNTYHMDVSFSPGQLTVNAFGTVQTLNQNNSPIQVASFEIQLSQQDAFFDNIYYSNSPPPADTTPPVWDTTTGIVSAVDTGAGGSVRVYFGGATDAVDGTNVSYNVYYAPSSAWSNDWSLNGVVSAAVGPATVGGLTNGVPYTFGVRAVDQDGNEDTNVNTLTATPTFSQGSVLSDDFSSDTTSEYTVVNTPADGVNGSFTYDGSGQRLRILTADNVALQFSRNLAAFSTGYFSFDFSPTKKYPYGGIITIRLLQDQNNYYEIVYSDGYANRQIRKIVNGVTVESKPAAIQYIQNKNYKVDITFSPDQLKVAAFGVIQTLSLNISPIQVTGFEIKLSQQDGYIDNLYYSDSSPPGDTEPPVWNTTTGIVSADNNGMGGSVTVSFGSAIDAQDGSSVIYSIYYAPSSIWNSDWNQNNIVSPVTSSYVVTGLIDGVEYTFGVRVSDQSGNMDNNTVVLKATPNINPGGTVFFDDFSDGNANGWTVVSNSQYKTPDWKVENGMYKQLNDLKGFDQSYHLGTYSYYNNASPLVDYHFSAKIIPTALPAQIRDTVGVMFRYVNNNNYYRFSMSQFQGFSRLEKKVNGVFHTLAVNGRGYNVNLVQNVSIDLVGSKIFVSVNNDPIFSVKDSSLTSGTVALYAMGQAQFDEVLVSNNTITEKKVSISSPTAYSVDTVENDIGSGTLSVSALTLNVPSGGGVKFLLDGSKSSGILSGEPYSTEYYNVSEGDHTLSATMYNASNAPINEANTKDTNVQIGMVGKIFVAIGDSLTNGTGDNLTNDDKSSDGRNVSRGFTPILNDDLASCLLQPIIVFNEGIGGSKSFEGDDRLNSTIDRYPKADYWLILFGTNDALTTLFTPSGDTCSESDFIAGNSQCRGTYKEYLRSMILTLKSGGRIPLLAKVPFVSNATTDEDARIRSYNTVIDQLVQEHNIAVVPPDLYTYFRNNPSKLADHIHPTGQGYISMATLWYQALTDQFDGIFRCQ